MTSPGSDLLAKLPDRDLAREGLLVAEGRLVVERLLAAPGCELLEVRCVPALEEHIAALVAGRCPLVVASESETSRLLGFPFHRGVVAVARRPPPLPPSSLLLACAGKEGSSLLVLPGTRDPENLGSLARSAAALGMDGILLGPGTVDFLSRRVLRVSMGAALSLPHARFSAPDGLESLGPFLAAGYETVAAVVDPEGAVEVDAWVPPRRCLLLLGEEYAGLGAEWRGTARVTIGMAAGPDSLNVAAAGAILMKRAAVHRDVSGLVRGPSSD